MIRSDLLIKMTKLLRRYTASRNVDMPKHLSQRPLTIVQADSNQIYEQHQSKYANHNLKETQ